MLEERLERVADALYFTFYEATFGGKDRGRFLVSRDDLRTLLGVKRLHASTVEKLIDACLELGLVVIDMESSFGFAEAKFVEKWRKVPTRLIDEQANQLSKDEDDEIDDLLSENADDEDDD